MDVRELEPREPGHGWDEFVERHRDGTPFHRILWRDLVVRHFRHRPRYLEVREGGRRAGVLPLFETRSPLTGRALISVPYGVYGGPLVAQPAARDALLAAVRALVEDGGYRFAELRCRDAEADGLQGTDRYVTFRRTLPADPEECLAVIPRKSRATTRQARDRHGLRLEEVPDRVGEFHRLFVQNKQRLGSPAFSRSWFEDVIAFPGRLTRLHAVFQGERILAAALSFVDGEAWNPYWSGAVAEADRLGASNFLYWRLMCLAVEEGCTGFDFGRSRVDTGAYHFKRHMGFEPEPLAYRYVLGAAGRLPEVHPSNPRFSLAQQVLRRLPYPVARVVGPRLMALVP